MTGTPIRKPGYVEFDGALAPAEGWRTARARGKTFLVEWLDAIADEAKVQRSTDDETIAVFPSNSGGVITIAGVTTMVSGRSIVIVPAGQYVLRAEKGGTIILLSPLRRGVVHSPALNEDDYDDNSCEGMVSVAETGASSAQLQVIPVDDIVPPADKPRLKIIRSRTMSVSWIEYEGLRDRTKLSPHDHTNFEQGSLAIEGAFIHHLRVPWGPDATIWRDDMHLHAAPRSLCVIPPRMIHTTEGEGGGKHILLDIFAPAREDFVSKGWVFNQHSYQH
ncbi:hypothetical protein JAU75_13880 [Ochrobactrum sp. Q0168]|uniref:hypothetical protein n=1 Tax=Ochrobactrum sp. Q0168 TaxID=2793241 RepID=UPI0018EC8522|nr:hypothetical protein [Ochrobactrum sp. Q0168]